MGVRLGAFSCFSGRGWKRREEKIGDVAGFLSSSKPIGDTLGTVRHPNGAQNSPLSLSRILKHNTPQTLRHGKHPIALNSYACPM
jgi:hypothetical protein